MDGITRYPNSVGIFSPTILLPLRPPCQSFNFTRFSLKKATLFANLHELKFEAEAVDHSRERGGNESMRNVHFLKFANGKYFNRIRHLPQTLLTQIARWTCSQWVV